MNFDKAKIDAHEQKYPENSCIPSAIEMVLKLLGKASSEFYGLQDEWNDKKQKKEKFDASFGYFDKKKYPLIPDLIFERINADSRYSIEELFQCVDKELSQGKYVIISLSSSVITCHTYVIYEKKGEEYSAFSKDGSKTIYEHRVKKCVQDMGTTDILIYCEN